MENYMRILKSLLLTLALVSGFAGAEKAFGAHHEEDIARFDNQLSTRDWRELYDFLNTKRTMNISEKASNLTVAGDVRVDWWHTREKEELECGFDDMFWHPGRVHVPRNFFDIEFNLYFDYVCDRAWGVVQVAFDERAGAFTRQCFNDDDCDCDQGHGFSQGHHRHKHKHRFRNCIFLKKAYMGYNLCCTGDTRLDIELGRRQLYQVFDSEVQFLSRFDGLLMRYTSRWDCFADWYLYVGGFLLEEGKDHFGYVAELGLLNICDLGLDLEYSFIDWNRVRLNTFCEESTVRGKFQVSQFTGHYHFDPEIVCMPADIYGAFLWNHNPNRNRFTHGKRKNLGWYAGITLGEVIKCGDWAVDAQYQYVQAQVIPDRDVSGIGRRGNFFDDNRAIGRGNTNYKGWRVMGMYALTDNLTVFCSIEASREIDKKIEGNHRFSQVEIETIYAF